jgi:hypothetical protein
VVRVHWDHVHPPEGRAAVQLAGDYPMVADRSEIYGDWDTLSDAEKLAVNNDLWETGRVEEAHRLHRALHQQGQRAAKAYFARLEREEDVAR